MAESGTDPIRIETSEIVPGVWELRLYGSLDWTNFAKAETAIDEIFRKGVYKIVVNLKGTKYISSAGFGCFISSLDTAMRNNGDLIFASTPPEIQDVFNILGLSKILHFANDTQGALAQFKQ